MAIAVPDLEAAAARYRTVFKADVSAPQALPEHGVTVVFVSLANTKIELLHPLGDDSPVRKFLERNPEGGVHHVCMEVSDIEQAAGHVAKHSRFAGDGTAEPKIGAHGKPVLFLHPKDQGGVLFELEQA